MTDSNSPRNRRYNRNLGSLSAWLLIFSLLAYWAAILLSGWDSFWYNLENNTDIVYSLILALLPAIILQVASLSFYIIAFKHEVTDLRMPNYWLAFTGSLTIIQFFILGLFLTSAMLVNASDLNRCAAIPTLYICDIPRLVLSQSFAMIQNGLWLPLGIMSLKAATKVTPVRRAQPELRSFILPTSVTQIVVHCQLSKARAATS